MKKVLMVASVACMAACAFAQRPNVEQTVSVDKAKAAESVDRRRCIGAIVSPQRVELVDRVSEELLEVGFKEGDFVKKGQLLYRLNDEPYVAAVKAIEAKIEAVKARLDYAEKNFVRQETLLKRNVASRDEFDAAVTERNARKAELAELEATLITARKNLRDTRILSPIDGKIGFNNFTVGNYLTPGCGVLATVIQTDPVRVRFPLSNADYMRLFGGEKQLKTDALIRLSLADGSAYPTEGTVSFVDNTANRSTDTVTVYADFANPDGVLIPGSTAAVTITKRTVKKCASVVPSAIVRDAEGPFVWLVAKDNTVSKRRVELGVGNAAMQTVLKGVQEGDVVVSRGTHKLFDGAKVKFSE